MRTRFVSVAVLAAVLTIALFGGPLALIVARYLLADERGEIERVADQAAVAAAVELAQGHRLTALPEVSTPEDEHVLSIYDAAGRRLAGSGPDRADALTLSARDQPMSNVDEGGDIAVAVPITSGGALLGVVRASTPRTEVYDQVLMAASVMIALALAALVGVALAARWMAGRLNRPLEHLAGAARTLGEGDFSVRVGRSGVPEIDAVAGALNSSAGRIDALIHRERRFSAAASHQLRTPLTALRLALEVAREDPRQDPRAALEAGIVQTDRLQRTIEDLLVLARDDDRAGTPRPLPPLLAELTQAWRPVLASSGRELRIRLTDPLPAPRASGAAIRQILGVLIDNAVTHGAGPVTVSVRETGSALAVDVSDDGHDIVAPTDELFSRRGHATAGHGIGLALARALAEAEDGRLILTSREPTTFSLLLPALEEPLRAELVSPDRAGV